MSLQAYRAIIDYPHSASKSMGNLTCSEWYPDLRYVVVSDIQMFHIALMLVLYKILRATICACHTTSRSLGVLFSNCFQFLADIVFFDY